MEQETEFEKWARSIRKGVHKAVYSIPIIGDATEPKRRKAKPISPKKRRAAKEKVRRKVRKATFATNRGYR